MLPSCCPNKGTHLKIRPQNAGRRFPTETNHRCPIPTTIRPNMRRLLPSFVHLFSEFVSLFSLIVVTVLSFDSLFFHIDSHVRFFIFIHNLFFFFNFLFCLHRRTCFFFHLVLVLVLVSFFVFELECFRCVVMLPLVVTRSRFLLQCHFGRQNIRWMKKMHGTPFLLLSCAWVNLGK